MQLRYNYRVYPTPGQQESLARAFGCARVVFNDGLRLRQETREAGGKYVSDGELSRRLITEAKVGPERAWLGEVSSVVLQQALADLNTAYRNFFNSIGGKRKGRKVAPPRFRSRKDNRQAIRFTKNSRFKVLDNGRLRLPKVGDVEVRWSRDLTSDPSSVTIVKDAAGLYHASFVVQTTEAPLPEVDSEIGIDLGLTHFAVLSDGTKVTAPKFLRQAARKLKRLQRNLSRKQRGSQNRKKAVAKVARAHARVADTRRDWQHKLSTKVVRDNQAIYVEDLCVVGLGRTRLAKSVHDAGWASFTAMLEYKAARYGRTFGRIDRFTPSTGVCPDTGTRIRLDLSQRWWDCPCGQRHDRDVAAAQIILAVGRTDKSNDRGAQVRPGLVPAPRGEAIIHPDAGVFHAQRGGNLRPLGRRERQANYLVLPRTLLQSMPEAWQQRFVGLLDDYSRAFAHIEQADAYEVTAGEDRYVNELDDGQLAHLGITPAEGDEDEEEEGGQSPSARLYRDRDGNEISEHDHVIWPKPDPVPHYSRGRARVEPRLP